MNDKPAAEMMEIQESFEAMTPEQRAVLEKADQVAREVLQLSRNVLLVHLRYMDRAIDRLQFSGGSREYVTNGRRIGYNPRQVLDEYRQDKNTTPRSLLHMMLHCIFCHHLPTPERRPDLWDLACDIAIENTINELELVQLETARSASQKTWIEQLKKDVPLLTAEKIYYYLLRNQNAAKQAKDAASLFYTDNHEQWYLPGEVQSPSAAAERSDSDKPSGNGSEETQADAGNDTKTQQEEGSAQNMEDDSDQNADPEQKQESSVEQSDQPAEQEESDTDSSAESGSAGMGTSQSRQTSPENHSSAPGQSAGFSSHQEPGDSNLGTRAATDQKNNSSSMQQELARRQEEQAFWKSVSEEMQVALENFFQMAGKESSSLIQSLKAVNRESWDYTEFLRQFAVSHEVVKVNEDEFDYIYYTLGLDHYGNLPLIEPLEYKEDKRVEEFVIALDTSGSVVGDQVQKFVQKTWNILKQEESFFRKVNIHIIQCDAEIQQDVKITSQEEFDHYIENMQLFGFGGTDFRPVFQYVDELIENKEFTNLKGMIYFTDGYGLFPSRMPDYKTAFVFVEDGYAIPQVPVWAIRLVLSRDEIEEKMA